MNVAQAWLAERMADVPAALAERMVAAAGDVAAADDAPLPMLLGEAALACLREALPRCDDRAAALHLLAADALITYACEAAAADEAAEPAGAMFDSLYTNYGTARLAARVDGP